MSNTPTFVGIILMSLLVLGICAIIPVHKENFDKITFYDLQYAQAPFGIFWVSTDGSFVFICGRVSSDLRESYVVKYMVENELHSLILDSEKTAVIADGTFRLEKIMPCEKRFLLYGYRAEIFEYNRRIYYKIHIPEFPTLNQTTSTNIGE